MAHFDGGAELLTILLSILGLYLILAAALLIQDIRGRRQDRKTSNSHGSSQAAPHVAVGP